MTQKEKHTENLAAGLGGLMFVAGMAYSFKKKTGFLLGAGYSILFSIAGSTAGYAIGALAIKDKPTESGADGKKAQNHVNNYIWKGKPLGR